MLYNSELTAGIFIKYTLHQATKLYVTTLYLINILSYKSQSL